MGVCGKFYYKRQWMNLARGLTFTKNEKYELQFYHEGNHDRSNCICILVTL